MLTFVVMTMLSQPGPPPLPERTRATGGHAPAAAAVPPSTAGAPSLVRVRCASDCTVRLPGSAGRRVDALSWEFSHVDPGATRFEVEGFASLPMASGNLDIPAASEVDVLVAGNRLTLGAVRPRDEPLARPSATPPTSMLRLSCPKPCTVLIDGKRRSSVNQLGQLTISGVEPGTRQVVLRFLTSTAQSTVDVPPDSEVFLYARDSTLRVTTTRPLH